MTTRPIILREGCPWGLYALTVALALAFVGTQVWINGYHRGQVCELRRANSWQGAAIVWHGTNEMQQARGDK